MMVESTLAPPYLSVVLPVYNEEENLHKVHSAITEALSELDRTYEIVYVDDGSTDSSVRILRDIAHSAPEARVVLFRRNFGQTAAMQAGFDHSRGEVIVTLDADLQNDPRDIPRLIELIEQGYDVVSGWRKNRQDTYITRKLPSAIANWLISRATDLRLHDYGCTLKAYRRELFRNIQLYGEMHRFIPAYAHWAGASVVEVAVNHHPRVHGVSKYGLSRTFKVLLDLMTLVFMFSYATKPIYVFGGAGVLLAGGSLASGVFTAYRRYFLGGEWMSPLLFISFLLGVTAVQFVLMGLLAEIGIRTYHESQGKPTYIVREVYTGPAGEVGSEKCEVRSGK